MHDRISRSRSARRRSGCGTAVPVRVIARVMVGRAGLVTITATIAQSPRARPTNGATTMPADATAEAASSGVLSYIIEFTLS